MKREYPVRLYLCGLLLAIAYFSPILVLSQGVWTQKADLPGIERTRAVGFSFSNAGYIGFGYDAVAGPHNDLWRYEPITNTWSQKSAFGGMALISNSVAFTIGSKGYVGTAIGTNNNEFWAYDTLSDSWTQKADFAGSGRWSAVGFSIGAKGYIGTGESAIGNMNDFWEYDPSINAWSKRADFPGAIRREAIGFSIGSRGFICGGYDGFGISYGDLWEFDPASNAWMQKADFGSGNARYSAASFTISGVGFIGTGCDTVTFGYLNDFWSYDPTSNLWFKKTNFGGPGRLDAVGFAIGNKGYIGTGFAAQITELRDFWEYDPNGIGIEELEDETLVAIFPNPIHESATISVEPEIPLPWNLTMVSITGQEVKNTGPVYTRSYTLERSSLPSGSYVLKISYGQNRQCMKKALIL